MASPLATYSAIERQTGAPISAPGGGEVLACPVCRGLKWNLADGVRGVALSRCADCGLLGTTHFVAKSKTTDDLYDVEAEDLAVYCEQYLPHRLALYARFLPELQPFRQTGKLLEVGSGYGYFLEMANAAGWRGEGVEISPYCCQVARQRGYKVWQAHLEDADLIPSAYDVVVLWDVIEHFTEPDAVVRRCHSLLRPGGALVMRTPDGRALDSTLQPMRTAYRHLVYPANTAEHVFHFKPQDLATLVIDSGFEVRSINCEQRWKELVISGNNDFVRAARWLIMRYAHWWEWPYEFVLTAVKK